MKNKKKEFINMLRHEIEKAPAKDLPYDFVLTYTKYMNLRHNYLYDEGLTSIEAHTLKHICQNPGVTITDIVNYWGRTKGTVSAQISELENKGFVKREMCNFNRKKTHIFPTEKGLNVNEYHSRYDIEETAKFIEWWTEKYELEESADFFEKMQYYLDFLNKRIKDY